MTTLSEANAKFTVDFFCRLIEEHPYENLMFSPINLISALGQLAMASGAKQVAQIEKILHWNEVKEAERTRNQRYPIPDRICGPATNRLKLQEKIDVCPKPQPETAYPKQRPRPEPMHPKSRSRPETAHHEPTCPNSRPCPQPSKPPSPKSDVPEYECETPEGVQTAFSKTLAPLYAPSTNYSLIFANKVYYDTAIVPLQKIIYCILKLYLSGLEGADIRNSPELVRRTINLWVEIQTHGKIMDLFPKKSFDSLGQVLHTNVLYFKGQWQMKFDKQLTVEAPFYQHYADERYCQNVLLMNRKGIYNTATIKMGGIVVQVLEIPYKNNEVSLLVLLPTDCSPGALQQLEKALTYEFLLDCSSLLRPTEVDVFIPRFSLERRLYAIDYLDLANLSDREKNDFSLGTSTKKVALTQLIHDTFIEIDEKGGEEAEAPCSARDKCTTPEAVAFVANHPFLYYIQHNCTQNIIAIGRFSRPE